MQQELISVVIPAYNAENTLHETLVSVRAQTYTHLDIIVVDDGSTDRTLNIAEKHAGEDGRVRIIRQQNGGVAAARNRGTAEAKGDYIAFIDADDLWLPEKLALQYAVFKNGPATLGLVYTWSAYIDEENIILSVRRCPVHEGDVLDAIATSNFVNNGSAPLVLKKALLEIGGFDSALRAAKAQGCEDYQLYFRLAEKYHFGVVRQHLTGYRQFTQSMSSDVLQMLRSYDLFIAEFWQRHSGRRHLMAKGRVNLLIWLLWRALRAKKAPEAVYIVKEAFKTQPAFAAYRLFTFAPSLLKFWRQALGIQRRKKLYLDIPLLEDGLKQKRAA